MDLADNLVEVLTEEGFDYNINRRALGRCSLKFASYFSAEAASILPFASRSRHEFENIKSREILCI